MKLPFEQQLKLFCAVFLIGFAVIGTLFYKVNHSFSDTSHWVIHTHQVLYESEQVVSHLKDVQIVKTDMAKVAPEVKKANFELIYHKLLLHVTKLKTLTSDNRNQQRRIVKLQKLIDDQAAEVRHQLEENIRSGSTQPISKNTDTFMHEVRDLMDQIQNEEDQLLVSRNEANNGRRQQLTLVFNILLVAGIFMLFVISYVLLEYMKLRNKMQRSALAQNKTLEKQVEATTVELIEREKQYHLLLDNMLEGAQILDKEWRYIYVNSTISEQTGLAEDELIHRTMFEVFPGIENSSLFHNLQKCALEQVPVKFENLFVFPDGREAYYDLIVQPVKEGLFVLSLDITDRRLRELYREQYIKELEEVLFKISHEVRSPVVKILGVAQLLELSLITPEEMPMVMDSMKSCAILLDRYTRELSDFVSHVKESTSASDQ